MADLRPILVPLDGSKLAENALPVAAWLSRITGAPIRFIHRATLRGSFSSKPPISADSASASRRASSDFTVAKRDQRRSRSALPHEAQRTSSMRARTSTRLVVFFRH